MNNRFKQQLAFIREIDKIKDIIRKTPRFDLKTYENDAEHSWHICMMALVLIEYSNRKDLNMLKVLKMLLVHDLCEIHAGDYIFYTEKQAEKEQKEREGAEKIFGLLPEDQAKEFYSLWEEFEARITPESKFARVVDRLEPIMQNYYNDGKDWVKHKITSEMILEKNVIIKDGSEELWAFVQSMVEEIVERGIIK